MRTTIENKGGGSNINKNFQFTFDELPKKQRASD